MKIIWTIPLSDNLTYVLSTCYKKASLFDITLSSIEHFLKNTSTYPCSLKRNQEPYAQLKKSLLFIVFIESNKILAFRNLCI